jgi:hypothetical protein
MFEDLQSIQVRDFGALFWVMSLPKIYERNLHAAPHQ